MTEAEWLAADTPHEMAAWLMLDARWDTALRAWVEACRQISGVSDFVAIMDPPGLHVAVDYWRSRDAQKQLSLPARAALLRCVVGNPFRPVRCRWCAGDGLASHEDDERKCGVCGGSGGFPLAWLTTDVLALARAAHEEMGRKCEFCKGRGNFQTSGSYCECPKCKGSDGVGTGRVDDDGTLDPVRLAVLADALMDAGCTDEAVLRHLRGEEGPCPYRGALAHSLACHWCSGKIWRRKAAPCVQGCHVVAACLGQPSSR